MGRRAEPRWYESRKAWYVEIGGKQILLAKGKAGKREAFEKFHRMMAEGASPARRADLSVQVLCDLFLAWSDGRVEPATLEGYVRRLQSFVEMYGASRAADIRPFHVGRWLESHPAWNDSTRFGYVTAIKRAYNWARKQGHLDANPIAEAERPAMGRRTRVLSEDQARKVIAHISNQPFRDLVVALWETGCRPAELVTLTADRVSLEARTWSVINKTRRKTGRQTRTIPLNAQTLEISGRLVALHPEGPIFRNTRGNPWTRHAMACAFADIRRDLGYGPEVCAYAFRHRMATDALLGREEVATVATMMGHSGVAMVMRHYSHLADHPEHLRAAAAAVRPDASPGGGGSGAPPPGEAQAPPLPPLRPRRTRGKSRGPRE